MLCSPDGLTDQHGYIRHCCGDLAQQYYLTVPAAEKEARESGGGITAKSKRLKSNAKQYPPMPIIRLANATDASPMDGAKWFYDPRWICRMSVY